MKARAAVLSLALVLTGCGSDPPDYSSILTSASAAAPTTTTPAGSDKPQPIAEYLYGLGVTGEQVPLDKLTDLTVTLPKPPGWTKYANPNFSPGTTMIAKNNTYPTAMVVVLKLTGNFDVAEALKHANVDAEINKSFTKLNSSNDTFNGFPSAMIEGSYDLNGKRMQSYNRVVIANDGLQPPQRYLIQLTVTTYADEAAAQGPDIESIIAGFNIAKK